MYHSMYELFTLPKIKSKRSDCMRRYEKIFNAIKPVQGRTYLDFGCAEGFFGMKLLQDGARHVTFVEIDRERLKVLNNLASSNFDENRYCILEKLPSDLRVNGVIYLDLIYANDSLPTVYDMSLICDELIISPSQGGLDDRLIKHILSCYVKAEVLYRVDFIERAIFRCCEKKII